MYIPEDLFLDLETIPAGDYPVVTLPPKPTEADVKVGNRKGIVAATYRTETLPSYNEKWLAECDKIQLKAEEEYLKRAVHSMTCEVICLGYAFDDHPPEIINGTEAEIIQGFNSLLNRFGDKKFAINIIGHNVIDFDLKILFHRAVKYNQVALVRFLLGLTDFQGKERLKDTMRMWSLLSWKDYNSLDDIAKFLNVGGKGDIDGSMVYQLYKENKLTDIYNYCKDDVDLARNVYRRIKISAPKEEVA